MRSESDSGVSKRWRGKRWGSLPAATGLLTFLVVAAVAAPAKAEGDAPPVRRGFQMALRMGAAIPLGNFNQRLKMSEVTGVQVVPFTLDIGGKLGENVFLGGYLGWALGGSSSGLENRCKAAGGDCDAVSVRGGIQVHYQFSPAELINPWIGYGLGFEYLFIDQDSRDQDDLTLWGRGVEYGHFMGGADFRLSSVFGIGPFVDYSIGQFNTIELDTSDDFVVRGDIGVKAIHHWIQVGARGTFLP